MSEEDAMCAYIKEMKIVAQKILNTIPLEDASPEMFEPFRPLYDVIPDMPRPPDSFFKTSSENAISEDAKEQMIPGKREEMGDQHSGDTRQCAAITEEMETGTHSGQEELQQRRDPFGEATHPVQTEQRLDSWGSANDKECDDNGCRIYPHLFQASDVSHKKTKTRSRRKSADRRKGDDYIPVPHSTNDVWLRSEENGGDTSSALQTRSQPQDLSPQIKATVQALQASIQGLCQRLESLERALQDQRQYTEGQIQRSQKVPKQQRPALAESQTFLFIVVWPFVVHWLLHRFLWRKR